MRCVSNGSCLCNSELCGFPKELWPSSPNRHPHSERHSNLSCQCSLWPSWPPSQYICCLKQTRRKTTGRTDNKVCGNYKKQLGSNRKVVTCGCCHQVSTDGARSVCCKCQGDVPQETIKGLIVFQVYGNYGNDHEPWTVWKVLKTTYPCWSLDHRGSVGITVVRNLSCLSSR